MELCDFPAKGQVFRLLGIAQHDVGAGVDELPVIQPRHWFEPEFSSGNRDADGMRMLRSQVGWQVGHAGGGFRLPIHDEKVPAALAAQLCIGSDALREQDDLRPG